MYNKVHFFLHNNLKIHMLILCEAFQKRWLVRKTLIYHLQTVSWFMHNVVDFSRKKFKATLLLVHFPTQGGF